MSKDNKPKSPQEYLKEARLLRDVVPSLEKYKGRRSKLNRWEKAAITRAVKKVNSWGGRSALTPLTKSEAKRLKTKKAIIGEGIRALHVTNVGGAGKTIDKEGRLFVRQKTRDGRIRKFTTVDLELDINEYLNAAEEILNNAPRPGLRFIFVWTIKGRAGQGRATLEMFARDLIDKYFQAYKETDQWMLGIMYYDETPRNRNN